MTYIYKDQLKHSLQDMSLHKVFGGRVRALDYASINDQVEVNGGHQPTEVGSGTGQVIWRYVKNVAKARWCSEKV